MVDNGEWDARKARIEERDIYIYKGYVYEISYGYTRKKEEWDDGKDADGVVDVQCMSKCVYRVARLFFAAVLEVLCTEKVRLIVRESLLRCAVTLA